MTPAQPKTFIELFSGGGMASAGLGGEWHCLLACDHDPAKVRAYRENWSGHPVVVQDVRELTAGQVGDRADLLWASPPCQDVSIAGPRGGLDSGRGGSLWPALDFVRQLSTAGKAPRIVAIENVPGLATGRQNKDLAAICGVLADLGYRTGALLIDAKLLVPQSRLRLFIVAVAQDIQVPAGLLTAAPVKPWHPAPLVKAVEASSASLEAVLAMVAAAGAGCAADDSWPTCSSLTQTRRGGLPRPRRPCWH